MINFIIICIILHYAKGEGKDTIQAGQPTHFHMEDRGPEIQVTADAMGVKINAKPAGLNVVAKPGQVPGPIPIDVSNRIQRIIHAPLIHSDLIRHSDELLGYNNGGLINGLAVRGGGSLAYGQDSTIGEWNHRTFPLIEHHLDDAPQIGGGDFPEDYIEYMHWKHHHHHHHHPHFHHGRHGGRSVNNFYYPHINWVHENVDDDYYD